MKKLLVIGAGFLQDFVIKKAVSMGYVTLAVDADPNAIGFASASKYAVIDITNEAACLEYAMSENIDGVLTAATDYGVLTAAYIAREMNLPGLNYEIARLIKNKYLVRKCLYENKADNSGKAYMADKSTNLNSLLHTVEYPVIVKPCDGSGSRGTSKVLRPDDLIPACRFAMDNSLTGMAEIEPFISGTEYGAETLVTKDGIFVLAIMKKRMTDPPYYAELGHSIPSELPIDIEQKAIACVESSIRALGINFGSVNCDMIITKTGDVHIIDIGARMGGNMIGPCIIPYGTGIDYMGAMIKNAMGEEIDLSSKPHQAVATRLLAFNKGVIRHMPDIKSIENEFKVEIYHHMSAGMQVNEYHTNLDGCGYIISKGKTVTDAINRAELSYEKVKRETFEV